MHSGELILLLDLFRKLAILLDSLFNLWSILALKFLRSVWANLDLSDNSFEFMNWITLDALVKFVLDLHKEFDAITIGCNASFISIRVEISSSDKIGIFVFLIKSNFNKNFLIILPQTWSNCCQLKLLLFEPWAQ